MADEGQIPWLSGLPDEPEGAVDESEDGPLAYTDESANYPPLKRNPAKTKAIIKAKAQPAPKTKYEPFHW